MADAQELDSANPAVAGDVGEHSDRSQTVTREDVRRLENEDACAPLDSSLSERHLSHGCIPDALAAGANPILYKEFEKLRAVLPRAGVTIQIGASLIREADERSRLSKQNRMMVSYAVNACLRYTRLFLKLAALERKSGAHLAVGTLPALVVSYAQSELESFRNHVDLTPSSLVHRIQTRRRLKRVGHKFLFQARQVEKYAKSSLRLGALGAVPSPPKQPLVASSTVGRLKQTAEYLQRVAASQDGINDTETEDLALVRELYPFLAGMVKSGIKTASASGAENDSATSDTSTAASAAVEALPPPPYAALEESELDEKTIPFSGQASTGRWKERAWEQISSILTWNGQVGGMLDHQDALPMLHRLLVSVCQIGDGHFDIVETLSEIIVATLRHRFDTTGVPTACWRLCSGLGLLAVCQRYQRHTSEAIAATAEAVRLFESTFGTSTKESRQMLVALNLNHARNIKEYLRLYHRRDATMAELEVTQMRRASAQAALLARQDGAGEEADLSAKLCLGEVLLLRIELTRRELVPGPIDDLRKSTRKVMSEEAIEILETADPERPSMVGVHLIDLYSEDDFQTLDKLDRALDLAGRWASDWREEFVSRLVQIQECRVGFLEQAHRLPEAVEALTYIIDNKRRFYRYHIHFAHRARLQIILGNTAAARDDCDRIAGVNAQHQVTSPDTTTTMIRLILTMIQTSPDDTSTIQLATMDEPRIRYEQIRRQGSLLPELFFLYQSWVASLEARSARIADILTGLKIARQCSDMILEATDDFETSEHQMAAFVRALVFESAIFLRCDLPDVAKGRILTAVEIVREQQEQSIAADGPHPTDQDTRKTMWLLLAHVLAEEGEEEQAEAARCEARELRCHGFFHALNITPYTA